MANGQDTYVALPNGSYVHVPAAATPEQLAALRTRLKEFAPQPEGFGTKVGRGAVLGAFSGAGIPETMTPLQDLAKGLKQQFTDLFRPFRPDIEPLSKEEIERSGAASPLVAVPRALGTTGKEILRDVYPGGKLSDLIATITHPGGARTNRNIDPEKLSHDVAQLVTQIALLRGGKKAAETPISEGQVAGVTRGAARGFLGVGKGAEKVARAESEAAATEALGKHAEKVEEARVKDVEKTEAVRGKKAAEIRETEAQRLARSKLETKKTSLGVLKDRVAERVAENLDTAEKAEETSLNKRYAPFNKVIDAGKFDLADLEQAIGKTREEIFKGTVQNEPIFNSILSRIKNKVEAPSGEVSAVPGENMISGDQLRGYISELGNEMFKGTELPADVYKGLKNVRQAAKNLVQRYVDDTMGKQAGQAYRQLQKDWSNYEQTWYDRSSGSPLRNALKTIRTTGRNVSVYREVANQLLRQVKGEQAIEWLGKKQQFGAKPDLLAQLRRVDREMKAVKVPGEVGEVEPPKLPKPTEVKPPEIEAFDPEAWRRGKISKETERMGNVTGWDVAALGYALREIFQGDFPWALGYPVGKRVLAYLLRNPSVVKFLAEGKGP